MIARALPVIFVSLLGCSPRSVPPEIPSDSAASPELAEGKSEAPLALGSADPVSNDPKVIEGEEAPASHEIHDHGGKNEGARKFVCPMHSEVVSNEPGDCPICGMHLEMSK